MSDCIFCNIASGTMGTALLYEDEKVVAFKDVNPQAPVHILIIPRKHYSSIAEVEDEELIGRLFSAGKKVAQKLGIDSYRFIINTGREAGQTVFHLHLHLMGGRVLYWPPG